MKQLLSILLVLAGFCLLDGCGDSSGHSSDLNTVEYNNETIRSLSKVSFDDYSAVADEEILNNFVNDYNQFAIDLYLYNATYYDTVKSDPYEKANVASASFSSFQLLGMTALGTSSNTAAQFREGYSYIESLDFFKAIRDSIFPAYQMGSTLTTTNIFVGQRNFLFFRNYLDNLSYFFQPQFYCLDFGQLGLAYEHEINILMSDFTDNLATSTFSEKEYDNRVKFVRGNATLLSENWQIPFNNTSSFDGLFETLGGIQYRVPIMRKSGLFDSYEDDTVSVFEVPFEDGRLAMTVLMPKEGQFDSFEEGLNISLPEIISLLQPTYLTIYLPQFSFDYSSYDYRINRHSFEKFLLNKGVLDAFVESKADYSGVNGRTQSFLSEISESVHISIGESVVSAAGASLSINEEVNSNVIGNIIGSVVIFSRTYIKEGTTDVYPFIFVIRDTQTGSILFLGRLVDAGGVQVGNWV